MDKKEKWAALLLWLGEHAALGPPAALSLALARLNEQLYSVLLQVQPDCSLTQAIPVGVQ
ncbi:hypothetical protein [Hymenobacter cellulosilyticus]|uniref:Uncharacterized protein n=1 Tax=Hymenobacter cellulosilyticus TaxID=2932248 RepID=A0A8T9Q713_9BACT|nr:hypothetical protein [Hymenobacter cellulosilyticus]UOQ72742.1 hypothetical protein MUN79_01745 [Hymenobacter cellulosilyticus]